MRLFVIHLVTASALIFSAGSAGAIEYTLTGADGGNVAQGSQFTLEVTINTEALTGITLLSLGVLFDDTRLTYNKDASSATSYALFGGRTGNGFLQASQLCGGYPSDGTACSIRVNTTNQVNIDYVSASLGAGTQEIGTWIAASLVFDVFADAELGTAALTLTQTSPGNTIALAGGGQGIATLVGDGSVIVIVPEPGIAGLSLAALLTVTTLRTRGRRRSEAQ
jgi:hypothetical protein